MNDSRIYNRLPIAREGIPFVLGGFSVAVALGCLGLLTLACLAGALGAFMAYFFRDPERRAPADPGVLLAPADGRVLEVVALGREDSPLQEPVHKVSIFMSIFDVHVNRVPTSGIVSAVSYHAGRFFAANLDKASIHNEKNRVTLDMGPLGKVMLIQIAGIIARRIVCWVNEGDPVRAGQRFGLIRFGSRVEILVPAAARIRVRKGQKVRAGQTVIGHL